MDEQTFDPKAFRQALGSFATGVTIITTQNDDGEPVGLTVNSFNSVSMDPPMVLWSLDNNAMSLPIFRHHKKWAVHVLSTDQAELSTRFAKRGEDKFADLELDEGIGGTPLLRGCSARFQCETAFEYEGGDHVIFVGEVRGFDTSDVAPLVFHGGRYAHATQRDSDGNLREPYLGGSFNDNFLGYLLGRCHFGFFGHIRPLLEGAGLTDLEFYILSTLTLRHRMTTAQLQVGMTGSGVDEEHVQKVLAALVDRGYVVEDNDASNTSGYELSDEGSRRALQVISAAKAEESQVMEGLGYEESAVLKSLLSRFLDIVDPDASQLWLDETE